MKLEIDDKWFKYLKALYITFIMLVIASIIVGIFFGIIFKTAEVVYNIL